MSPNMQWARKWPATRRAVADSLRKGAWYRVLEEKPTDGVLVLDVATRELPVPRAAVELRGFPPERFTVVYRTLEELELEAAHGQVSRSYAVCPMSGTRIPLSGHPESLECPECHFRGEVGWWETG